MKNWRQTFIGPAATIGDAIRSLDASARQICLVVDADERLLGTVTDGDIRRGLLRSLKLESSVSEIMNPKPITAPPDADREALLDLMTSRSIRKIPLIDKTGRAVGIADLGDLVRPDPGGHQVVILAGGAGTRLRPLTENTPKPLLNVGGKSLLESTIERLAEHGFRDIYLSVNYKAEMIADLFGDGRRLGVRIRYLRESAPLGTAGPLSLLPERPSKPLIVMNGDLLTTINLRRLLEFHFEHGAAATMAVREQEFEIPYGVVSHEDGRFANIDEKPIQTFFINAGIYILEPDVLSLVPPGVRFDMTDLLKALSAAGKPVATFPICEYWLDIGRPDDLDRAERDYPIHFSKKNRPSAMEPG